MSDELVSETVESTTIPVASSADASTATPIDDTRSPSHVTVHPDHASPSTSSPAPSTTPLPPSASPPPSADEEVKEAPLPSSFPDKTLADDDEETIPVSVKKYTWVPPSDVANFPYRPHNGEGSQYLRDFILGVNDGLISTFLVVVGVVAGNYSTLQALLAAISSAVAGALSMGIGEYVATKSQLQVSDGEMRLESEHFKYHRDVELEQLRQFLANVNLSGNLLEAVVSEVGRSDEGLMKMMQAFEFGGEEELERNPWKAMWMSGRLFFIGSIPTVVPFFATSLDPHVALAIAAGLVGASLFVVGAYKTRTTKGNWLVDGAENFGLGAIGTGIAYAVGIAFDKASGGDA